MRKGQSASETAVYNIRARLRKDMTNLAKTHRGCSVARGCGCLVDKALTILTNAERDLFQVELDRYASPSAARRILENDNSITIEQADIASTGEDAVVGVGKR